MYHSYVSRPVFIALLTPSPQHYLYQSSYIRPSIYPSTHCRNAFMAFLIEFNCPMTTPLAEMNTSFASSETLSCSLFLHSSFSCRQLLPKSNCNIYPTYLHSHILSLAFSVDPWSSSFFIQFLRSLRDLLFFTCLRYSI